ncbi:MAG TPA: hypothetical protein VFF11_16330 [Candidatus Binatia bacterium]|nr:hypothetical protein [Candidatus Binatia bacterium]
MTQFALDQRFSGGLSGGKTFIPLLLFQPQRLDLHVGSVQFVGMRPPQPPIAGITVMPVLTGIGKTNIRRIRPAIAVPAGLAHLNATASALKKGALNSPANIANSDFFHDHFFHKPPTTQGTADGGTQGLT